MTIILYYMPQSPPCRSVMMLAKSIGVRFELKLIDVWKDEHLEPSFLEINPQHTVPTIDDNGFILCESRAIMSYLVSKYGKSDTLYSKYARRRAVTDQRLYYDNNLLYKSIIDYFSPVLVGKMTEPPAENLPALERSFDLLDGFLEESNFVAGDDLTIADYAIIVNVCTTMAFGFDIGRYVNVSAWYERCKKLMEKHGFEEFNEKQADFLGQIYKNNLKLSVVQSMLD